MNNKENQNINNISKDSNITIEYARKSFFKEDRVKQGKDYLLHERLQTLIRNQGLSNNDFYRAVGISRQHYYSISYGLTECPIEIKLRISKTLQTDSSVIFHNNSFHNKGRVSCIGSPSLSNELNSKVSLK